MTEDRAFDLDAALDRLAAAEDRARPAPGDALFGRVLADAARVQQEFPAGHALAGAGRRGARGGGAGRSAGRGSGWRRVLVAPSGFARAAGAALAASLMLGFAVGFGWGGAPVMADDALTGEEWLVSDAGGLVFDVDEPF